MTEIGRGKELLDTPTLWVDLDVLEANIALLMKNFRAAGVNWRPHTKGIKIPAIAHKMIDAGAIGVTCAKVGEAEVMAAAGVTDILIANQVVGPQKYARLAALQRHANVKIAVDNTATLDDLSAAALDIGVEIPVLVELNVGMNRAGVTPGSAAVALAGKVHEQDGLRLAGLMAWEGHTLSVEDAEDRAEAIKHSIGQLAGSAQACREAGLPVEIVSCGGSGTMYATMHQPEVTEIQAGGAIFGDATYQTWGVPTDPALFGQVVVTSRPAPDRIITDAGFKTLPGTERQPLPVALENVVNISPSAEHGVITLSASNESVEVGDVLDFIVGYGDATVFLHDALYGVRKGVVETVWSISGRGKLR